jgi:hypothetical protein
MTNDQSPDFTPATPSEDVRPMQFGIRPEDLIPEYFGDDPHSPGFAVLREAAEHFSSPFEPADVPDEEIRDKANSIFGDEFSEVSEEIEEPTEWSGSVVDGNSGTYGLTSFKFSLTLPLRLLSAQHEATAFWFIPKREPTRRDLHSPVRDSSTYDWASSQERWFTNPLAERRERLAAEIDVRSTRWLAAVQGPSVHVEELSELHSFTLALPLRLDTTWFACKHYSSERPSSPGELLRRGTSETLLVLFDSIPASTTTVAPWKQRSTAVGEYQWRSPDRLRRWLAEVAEHLSERREVPRSEVGAVLWLADPRSLSSSPGAAALVPVPEWLQPARDHLPQLSQLWDSTLHHHLAREINDACRQ